MKVRGITQEPLANLSVILDRPSQYFAETITNDVLADINKKFFKELALDILRRLEVPQTQPGESCDAITATPYLRLLRLYFEGVVEQLAAAYSSTRWFWYLRRLPRIVFEGKEPTTYGYDIALAETASGLFGTGVDNVKIGASSVGYSTEGAVIKRVLRFCLAVRLMSQTHVLLRYAGKGVQFRFHQGNPFPDANPTVDEQKAISLYDARVSAKQRGFTRSGTAVTTSHNSVADEILVVPRMEPAWMPTLLGPIVGQNQKAQVFASFCPEFVAFDRLSELIADPRLSGQTWIGPEVSSIFALLNVAPVILANLTYGMPSLMERGYLTLKDTQLRDFLDAGVPAFARKLQALLPRGPTFTTGEEVLASLEGITGTLWPLRMGPIIRRGESMSWVDLHAATTRLEVLLEFPRIEGNAANARAEHFELSVQNAIDTTKWAPNPQLRRLRRRDLRLGGSTVSDVDAVAAHKDTLLLISCKSLVYSGAYDVGDYQVIRNAASTVTDGAVSWVSTVDRLANAPRGDNYDFSEFKNLLPVVCTPHPIYAPLGPATREIVPGLRAVMSLEELVLWLQEN